MRGFQFVGNTDQIKAVIKYYGTLRGAKGKSVQYNIVSAMTLSDTRVAVLWLDKHGYLYKFAAVRDITEEQVDYMVDSVRETVEYLRSFSPVWRDLQSGKTPHIL